MSKPDIDRSEPLMDRKRATEIAEHTAEAYIRELEGPGRMVTAMIRLACRFTAIRIIDEMEYLHEQA